MSWPEDTPECCGRLMVERYANYGFMNTRIVEKIWYCEVCGKDVPK